MLEKTNTTVLPRALACSPYQAASIEKKFKVLLTRDTIKFFISGNKWLGKQCRQRSDQDLHGLPLHLHSLDVLLIKTTHLRSLRTVTVIILLALFFRT